MDEEQRSALEAFMQFYDSKESLGNWQKKVVGKIGQNPGYETAKSIGGAYEAIRTILVFRGEDELVAWLDEMHTTIIHYGVQSSILYAALKERDLSPDEDTKVLHSALNSITASYVTSHGFDDYCVDKALHALKRHPELPIRASLADKGFDRETE